MTLPLPDAPRRLVYFGTPTMAVPTLEALIQAGFDVALVVTAADARRSRRGDPEPSPVKAAASIQGIPVSHDTADATTVDADLGVVVAYGRIIPTSVLEVLPMVNLHFSLLPRWRGAAPVERTLLAGDTQTGVCVMDVVDALDEGDVFAASTVAITPESTLDSLRRELVEAGTDLLLDGLRNGFAAPRPQIGETTYAHKIVRAELEVDFAASAEMARRIVSVGDAWTTFRGKRLKIHRVAVGEATNADPGSLHPGPLVAAADRWLSLEEVQPEGKARMTGAAWANGAHLEPGDRLGT